MQVCVCVRVTSAWPKVKHHRETRKCGIVCVCLALKALDESLSVSADRILDESSNELIPGVGDTPRITS